MAYYKKREHRDLTGQKFNLLTVLNYSGKSYSGVMFSCKCDCGTIKDISSGALLSNKTKSCGCLHRKNSSLRMKAKHEAKKQQC